MAKRVRKVVHTGITTEQMETAFSEYATADARLAKINAELDVQITKLREKRADEISRLTEKKEKNFEIVQAFALENREELFSKKKSIEGTHGTYGFRTGTPQLKPRRGFTWAAALNLIKGFLPDYVRIKKNLQKICCLPIEMSKK